MRLNAGQIMFGFLLLLLNVGIAISIPYFISKLGQTPIELFQIFYLAMGLVAVVAGVTDA